MGVGEIEIWSRAPLRIGLAGGGTDLEEFYSKYGGLVVNATIDMYVYARITPFEGEGANFISYDTGEEGWVGDRGEIPEDGHGELPENMPLFFSAYEKVRKMQGRIDGHRIETYSDSPVGSGLGTSSSLCIAILKAYDEWLDLGLEKKQLALLAYEIERIDCGFKGGVQDQFAAAFGGLNRIDIDQMGNVEIETVKCGRGFIKSLESMSILHYSGRSRDSSSIISDQINAVEGSSESLKSMKRMCALAEKMVNYIENEEIEEIAGVISESWENKKKTSIKISNEPIEEVIRMAKENGALAAKVSGAGGGGHILFIVPFEKRNGVLRCLNGTGTNARVCNFTEGGAESWKISRLLK